jgi:hypothetical protein
MDGALEEFEQHVVKSCGKSRGRRVSQGGSNGWFETATTGVVACAAEGSKVQSGGSPKVAAAQVIRKSKLRAWLCRELEQREITGSKWHNMGSP